MPAAFSLAASAVIFWAMSSPYSYSALYGFFRAAFSSGTIVET